MKGKATKKFLAFALAVILLAGIVPVSVLAASSSHVGTTFTDAGVDYYVLSEDTTAKTGTVAAVGSDTIILGTVILSDTFNHTYFKKVGIIYLPDVTIKYTVTEIADNGFLNCTDLKNIRLPATLTNIGENAFAGCTKLETVYFARTTAPTIEAGAFSGVPSNVVYSVPAGTYSSYKAALPEGSIVRERGYAINLSESSLDFGSKVEDYASVDSQTITIANIGEFDVTLKQPTSDYFDLTLSRTRIPVGETATLTVTPKTGLTPGTYDGTIKVEGTSLFVLNTNRSFDVSFEVVEHVYSIAATPDEVVNFGKMSVDYDVAPTSETVTVENTGNTAVTIDEPTSTDFIIAGATFPYDLAPGDTMTFTVQPKDDLAIGVHRETISITGSNGVSDSVTVKFTVVEGPAISADKDTLDFGTVIEDYDTAPARQTVTITNSGTQPITLTQPTSTDYRIGDLSQKKLEPGESATFTIRPKKDLTAGDYSGTVDVVATGKFGGTDTITIDVNFEVLEHTYTITADPTTHDFGSLVEDYAAAPGAFTVTVENTGNTAVTIEEPDSDAYTVSGVTFPYVLNPGDTVDLTIQPETGLTAGTYAETIDILGNDGASTSVNVTFEVLAHSYLLSADVETLDFGSLTEGYATAPEAKTVTIENTGNTTVTLTQPTSDNFVIGTLSATELAPGEKATFTVQPKTALAYACYDTTLTVSGTGGASESVAIKFTVNEDYKFTTKLSDTTGISVAGLMKSNVQLVVSPLALGDDAGSGSIRVMQSNGDYTFLAGWNISLTGDFTGSFTITLPVDASYNGQTATILHAASSGLKTYSAVVTDGKITITVTEFSPFAVFVKAKTDDQPVTGDSGLSPIWLLLCGISGAGLLTVTVLTGKKRRD